VFHLYRVLRKLIVHELILLTSKGLTFACREMCKMSPKVVGINFCACLIADFADYRRLLCVLILMMWFRVFCSLEDIVLS